MISDGISYYVDYHSNIQEENTLSHFINCKDYLDINNFCKGLFAKPANTTISSGDKVFFLPGIDFPRFKLSEYGKNNNIRRTINISSASIIVIYGDLVEKFFEKYFTWNLFENKNIISKNGLGNLYKRDDKENRSYYNLSRNIDKYLQFSSNTDFEFLKLILYMQANPSKYKIITSDDLLNIVNTQSLILDKALFDNLDSMLASTDANSHNLALETICNTNYEKSIVKVLLLLTKHYNNAIAYSNYKNTVNFRTLERFISSIGFNFYGNTYDTQIIEIINKFKYTTLDNSDQEAIRDSVISQVKDYISKSFRNKVSIDMDHVKIID